MIESLGIVVIGRNEGERLHRCIESLVEHRDRIVYVDSASSDDSVAWARPLVAQVVELDPGPGLSAARARNAGMARLAETHPDLEYVQFVDGDCRVQPGWIEAALEFLRAHERAVVVCGRRREVDPESTIYNRLADLEWDTPVGPAQSCGGDAMMRVRSFREVGGYSDSLIAGEEPELCLRLRAAGGEIHRLPFEMTLHDAALTRFSQWWRRNARSGHASLELVVRHGRASGPAMRRRVRSIFIWALGPPLAIALAWPFFGAWSAIGLSVYGLLAGKIYRYERTRGRSPRHAFAYAIACCVGKFAELEGFLRFGWNRLFRRGPHRLIEYKGADG